MGNSQNYSLLISKLDQFIRKYYINQGIRGSLYSIGLILGLFLLFNVLEYNFYFDTGTRKLLFYSFLGVSIAAMAYWVVNPFIRYFHLGPTISHEKAASIIGNHFGDVKDKLLNILQLKKQESTSSNAELIAASIDQKTEAIKIVPFKAAIDLSNNKKYLKYALPPFLALIVLLFAAPSIIKDGTYRIINNDKKFSKAAPFHFLLEEKDLNVVQFSDFTLSVKVDGIALPNEAFVEVDNFLYKMDKKSNTEFEYVFRNVQKDTKFNLVSGNISGDEYLLNVLEKPNLAEFSINLVYPSYTGRKNEALDNIGDVVVPEGTRIEWKFSTTNTDDISLRFGSDRLVKAEALDVNKYRYKKLIKSDQAYTVFIANNQVKTPDSVGYSINVVRDQNPIISVEQFKDSVESNILYFIGRASDDYGLNSLTFNYQVITVDGKQLPLQTVRMNKDDGREIQYEKTFDIRDMHLKPGENLSYYFEVYDNDGVNGAKPAKTSIMTFEKPTIEEFKKMEKINEKAIKDKLLEAKQNVDQLQNKFEKMREKLLQEKKLDWQDKKELEKLVEEQKKLQEELEKAKEKFDENMKNQEEFQKPDEQVKEKQDRLKELFEEAMDPEQKELLDKIQELMQELEKDDALQMMEQFQMNNENKEKDMDRLLELYKQLEVEKDATEQIKRLEKLAEEQEKISKETEQKKPSDELKKEQEKLNKEMEDIKKKIEEVEKKNEELKTPKELGEENKEDAEEIQEEQEKSQDQMEKGDSKGASKSQKSAAQKMKKMASKMKSSMESGDQEQQAEDIKMIRQLLENLVTVSFDQEQLISDFTATSSTTPKYVKLIQNQYKLKEDFKIIEDSLAALSQRVDKIASFVTEKVTEVKFNMSNSIDQLEDRQTNKAMEVQRRTMTNINDLALMLSESMQNMQQQMSGEMPGSQMCSKPGGKKSGKSGGKTPLDKITEGQQGMGDELKKLQDKMGKDGKPSAKDFAQAAARQAALRKALEDARKERQEQGKGADLGLQEIGNQMDKIETELVNKRLNAETFKRQADILTRLLEAEKSERQREMDNKRKSETGKDIARPLPPALQEYLKKRQAEIEMYKSTSPSLKAHYKYLVDEYYKSLKSTK